MPPLFESGKMLYLVVADRVAPEHRNALTVSADSFKAFHERQVLFLCLKTIYLVTSSATGQFYAVIPSLKGATASGFANANAVQFALSRGHLLSMGVLRHVVATVSITEKV